MSNLTPDQEKDTVDVVTDTMFTINFLDLLPSSFLDQTGIEQLDHLTQDWGLQGVAVIAPRQPSPKLAYFIRRLRNALGHSNFSFDIPDDLKGTSELHKRVKITFRDQNPRDSSDTFETTLTMTQLELLIKKFHSVVHRAVATKFGIQGP